MLNAKPMPLAIILALAVQGCTSETPPDEEPIGAVRNPAVFDPSKPYAPVVSASELSPSLTHELFPAPAGARWTYEAKKPDGTERIEIEVLPEKKSVWGTSATVIRDTVFLDDEMIEDTWDWYAEDASGNVWYLGEETYEYENGQVVCECGAWESGVDQALPGVIMLADPRVADAYRQEYLKGEAEDYAEVVSLSEKVTVAAGSFTGCLKTRDRSAIDPSNEAFKYYCPGVGTVLEEEDGERVELISYSGL
jgi:hypothetical protein